MLVYLSRPQGFLFNRRSTTFTHWVDIAKGVHAVVLKSCAV